MANISSEVRKETLKRDNYQCQDCGVLIDHTKKGSYHLHHRDYKTNELDSLITLCVRCHRNTNHEIIDPFNSNTWIQVSKEIRAELNAIGKKGESYDDVIQRLIKNHKIYVED